MHSHRASGQEGGGASDFHSDFHPKCHIDFIRMLQIVNFRTAIVA